MHINHTSLPSVLLFSPVLFKILELILDRGRAVGRKREREMERDRDRERERERERKRNIYDVKEKH